MSRYRNKQLVGNQLGASVPVIAGREQGNMPHIGNNPLRQASASFLGVQVDKIALASESRHASGLLVSKKSVGAMTGYEACSTAHASQRSRVSAGY